MTEVNVFIPAEEDRLAAFKDLNRSKRKVPWEERVKLIREQFPSVARLDWDAVFRQDPTIMGRILNDIIKVSQSEPGKPGKRPGLDERVAAQALRQIQDDDYTTLPFDQALTALKGDRSIRALAAKVDLSRPHIFRLLNGEKKPSVYDMEQVAKAFKKEPSFFYEYRVAYITAVISHQLDRYPDSSVVFYNKIRSLGDRS